MSYQPVNIGTIPNDGTGDPARTAFIKCNSNFTELYNQIPVPLKLINQTGSFSQSIAGNSWVEKLIITPQIGTPSIMIGTTNGGNDILPTTLIGSFLPLLIQQYYQSGITLYFSITSGNANIRIDQIPNFF